MQLSRTDPHVAPGNFRVWQKLEDHRDQHRNGPNVGRKLTDSSKNMGLGSRCFINFSTTLNAAFETSDTIDRKPVQSTSRLLKNSL